MRNVMSSTSSSLTAQFAKFDVEVDGLVLCLLLVGVLALASCRKALEIVAAHFGTPIALCRVDFAVYAGS